MVLTFDFYSLEVSAMIRQDFIDAPRYFDDSGRTMDSKRKSMGAHPPLPLV